LPIASRLPDANDPSSRKYFSGSLVPFGFQAPPGTGERRTAAPAAPNFLDARGRRGPLHLEEAVDRVVCGDAAKVLKKLPGDWCACAVTSPPYWNTVDYGVPGQIGQGSYAAYLKGLGRIWREVERCLLPNGKFCLNVPLLPLTKAVSEPAFGKTHTRVLLDQYSDMKAVIEGKTSLRLYSLYIWEKQTTEKMFGSYPFPPNLYERNTVEFIAVFVKPGEPRKLPPKVKEASRLTQADWLDLTRQVWWMYPENVRRLEGHPAPFPETLPNRLISMYTFRAVPEEGFLGDIVLDPLCGSGMTCVAARRLGRRSIGVDLNPDFCAYAAQRVKMTAVAPAVMSAMRPSERKAAQGELAL
jgi:DNA modification methylase